MTERPSIHPGETWLDTNGRPIQAHGGSVIVVEGVYYWYGENKERTLPGSGIWHWGIRCYRSTDLVDWEDLGLIIPPVEDDPSSQLHPSQMADRPHILFNAATGLYVCWIKVMQRDGSQLSTVLRSSQITGPYEIVRTGFQPLGMNAGDFDLAVDPDTGQGYYIFEKVHTELIVAELTEDYTDVNGTYSSHFHRGRPPFVREAPAHFTHEGMHYLITSGTTGYLPNRSEVARSANMHGPWEVLGDPHPTDPTGRSFRSQVSSVLDVAGGPQIALADRWLPDWDDDAQAVHRVFAAIFNPDCSDEERSAAIAAAPPRDDNPDTSKARYVWLPIRWDGELPVIDWLDSWRPDLGTAPSSSSPDASSWVHA